MRGPYRYEFDDYDCWREAKVRFSQISTKPAIDTMNAEPSTKTHTCRDESIKRQICGPDR